jgi:hypothetical protein
MRFRGAIWLALPLGWVAGCGSRTELGLSDIGELGAGTSPGNGAASSGAGVVTNSGASESRGGNTSGDAGRGGAGSSRGGAGGQVGRAGGSVGGRSGAGGARATGGVGGGCVCEEVACNPPDSTVPNVDGCCSHCETSCEDRQFTYGLFRASVIFEAQAHSCTVDSECDRFVRGNDCGRQYCPVALRKDDIARAEPLFDIFVQNHCVSFCPQAEPPYCGPEAPPRCLDGHCR